MVGVARLRLLHHALTKLIRTKRPSVFVDGVHLDQLGRAPLLHLLMQGRHRIEIERGRLGQLVQLIFFFHIFPIINKKAVAGLHSSATEK